MNQAQRALLARLREIIIETPKSGALDAGKKPYRPTRFAGAVERRSEDGPALVKYVRSKIHEPATAGYGALVEAGHAELTVEAVVADGAAPWASEFTADDRAAAAERLGQMIKTQRERQTASEAKAVEEDRRIVTLMNDRRKAAGKPALTPKQESETLARMAAKRHAAR